MACTVGLFNTTTRINDMLLIFAHKLVEIAKKRGRKPVRWDMSIALWYEFCYEADRHLIIDPDCLERKLLDLPVELQPNTRMGIVLITEQD
jgi:hypothetical protein